MRAFLLGAILAAASGAAAPAQDTAAQIKEVISDQIEAFRVDDLATAFGFASPAIRDLFGTADRFGEMVREGYPMVWHPGSVRFADLQERGGKALQRVLVTDEAGALHLLEYEMVPLDGGWRIDGVRLLDAGATRA
jgi:hypothetical protein